MDPQRKSSVSSCTCEANLFYKKYRHRIEELLALHKRNETLLEEEEELPGGPFGPVQSKHEEKEEKYPAKPETKHEQKKIVEDKKKLTIPEPDKIAPEDKDKIDITVIEILKQSVTSITVTEETKKEEVTKNEVKEIEDEVKKIEDEVKKIEKKIEDKVKDIEKEIEDEVKDIEKEIEDEVKDIEKEIEDDMKEIEKDIDAEEKEKEKVKPDGGTVEFVFDDRTETKQIQGDEAMKFIFGSEQHPTEPIIELQRKEEDEERLSYYEKAFAEKLEYLFTQKYDEGAEEEAQYERPRYFRFERESESERSAGTYFKIPSSSLISAEEEEEYYQPVKKPEEWMSESQRMAEEYLRSHRIYELFHFLGSHILAANPCNPIDYLITLLDNCLGFREGYLEPPLLFQPKHVESLFDSMDPMKTGFMDINQYHSGMFTLGIGTYNKFPQTNDRNMVSKQTFTSEALEQLKRYLEELLQYPGMVSTLTMLSYHPLAIYSEG